MDVADLPPPPSAMCGICKAQLIPISHGHRVDLDNNLVMLLEYRHPPTIKVDHRPDPVALNTETINRCDFCSSEGGDLWTLICAPFVHENYHDDGEWAACDECVVLIRADDWDGMTARVKRVFAKMGGDRAASESALGLQGAFRRHFTGEITGP